MKVLFEGESYPIEQLKDIFDDSKFYQQQGGPDAIISSVGYYHSYKKGELVYMLPKVFMMKGGKETVFGIEKDALLDLQISNTIKHKKEYEWIRNLSVYFYNSLIEFKKRNKESKIVQSSLSANLNTNLNEQEYSYLDLLLSFVNFHKKNKNYILLRHIEFNSQQVRKPKWEKTIVKSIPFINKKGQPIYNTHIDRKKIQDTEEELFIYFFSILNHFNTKYDLHLKIDKSFNLKKNANFKSLQDTGLSKLRKIKHRYFNDTLKRMYHLCEMYFSQTDKSNIGKKTEEFISVSNYNIVFEDMVDKLFSDPIPKGSKLDKLKNQKDGKEVDHIFDHQSLLDTSNIFYIGDSKYYKSGNIAGELSKYKQFTYARNVIQYNIDLLNQQKDPCNENIRYRDNLTEGYNITPNFFIYGCINEGGYTDFNDDNLKIKGDVVKSYHFEDRLFDRDTLFVRQYEINFLYVLKAYSQTNAHVISQFRKDVKSKFRNDFVEFFSSDESGFVFYQNLSMDEAKIEEFVKSHFRKINGKCFKTKEGKLILAKYTNSELDNDIVQNFEPMELS